jgi:hypothetical protein
MINLTPEKITTASVFPSSNIIGAENLLFTVNYINKNYFEPDQQIWVKFPFWNPKANNPQHMIRIVNPKCNGLRTIKTQLTCYYD